MDDKTKVVLNESIKHWEDIRDGKDIEDGRKNCSLCKVFYANGNYCANCPICEEELNRSNCTNTPYVDWIKHFAHDHPLYKGEHRIICERCQEIAQEEVDFLKSLKEPESLDFKCGDILFMEDHEDTPVMCAKVGDCKLVLVGYDKHFKNLNRVTSPIDTEESQSITREEMMKLTGGRRVVKVLDHTYIREFLKELADKFARREL